ncbi:hypothetical protein TWF694_008362 [Orbilia ellipsospora]|uniref:Uncharacterized protein n=1 Tax=Orbilia ellipsospora TaxID=2528407 RepID=A0AAV9XHD3_9PEZI
MRSQDLATRTLTLFICTLWIATSKCDVPTDETDKVWNTKTCRVGLYSEGDFGTDHAFWAENVFDWYPANPDGSPACIRTADLIYHDNSDINKGESLENSIKSYRVAGDCSCNFFDNNDCSNSIFTAVYRFDSDLSKSQHDNLISSFNCVPDGGSSCHLQLWQNRDHKGRDYYQNRPMSLNPPDFCFNLPDTQAYKQSQSSYDANDCFLCKFYSQPDCGGDVVWSVGDSIPAGDGSVDNNPDDPWVGNKRLQV